MVKGINSILTLRRSKRNIDSSIITPTTTTTDKKRKGNDTPTSSPAAEATNCLPRSGGNRSDGKKGGAILTSPASEVINRSPAILTTPAKEAINRSPCSGGNVSGIYSLYLHFVFNSMYFSVIFTFCIYQLHLQWLFVFPCVIEFAVLFECI